MSSVISAIVKLPRYVKITHGIDENTALVLGDKYREYHRSYYYKNRDKILAKKMIYNQRPEVKKRSAERHHKWYLEHKEGYNNKKKEKRNKINTKRIS